MGRAHEGGTSKPPGSGCGLCDRPPDPTGERIGLDPPLSIEPKGEKVALREREEGGAAGCVGVAVAGQLGLAAKAWDGVGAVSYLAAAETLRRLGVFSATGADVVGPVINPPVLGGGGRVGWIEPRFELAPT